MCYSGSLEQRVGYSSQHSHVAYFSRNLENYEFSTMIGNRPAIYRHIDDIYNFSRQNFFERSDHYVQITQEQKYAGKSEPYKSYVPAQHSFMPSIFLSNSRPKTIFVGDNNEIKGFVKEAFELNNIKQKLSRSLQP